MVAHTLAYWWQRWSPGQPTWRDLIAGLSVAGLLLPEAVAYAGIGNMPPEAGVMALFVGLLCYGLLGGSRFAIVSATSSSAAVLFAATGSLAGGDPALRLALASGLVMLTGLLFLVGAAARVGAVSAFIAKPVLRGFTFGLALVIILKQAPKLVGLHMHAPDLQHLLPELWRQLAHWHLPSLAVGGGALVIMLVLGRLKQRVPVALVVMVLGIALQRWGPLADWGVIRVGDIQVNLALYPVPELDRLQWLRLGELAVAMVLILYAESYGSIRTLALRHGDRNEPNRDLMALGVANLFSSLLHGMPVGAGYSASVANEAAGARTKWSGLFAAGVLLIVVLTLLPYIEDLPEPVLGAIVVYALSHMVNPSIFSPYFTWHRDRLIALAAVAAVLWLGVLDGLLLAIAVSLFMTLRGLAQARVVELGRMDDTHDFIDRAIYPAARQEEGLVILRPEAPLFFGNVESLLGQVRHVLRHRPGWHTLILSLEESPNLDGTCVEALRDLCHDLDRAGQHVMLARLKRHAHEVLQRAALPATQLTVLSIADAVRLTADRRGLEALERRSPLAD
ncbi:MAG: SulP family inorganic anion transporter [Aquabacterium sp.]|nr:MAG: SulP family inorganic anion transporter [Aquabacterium sp.]